MKRYFIRFMGCLFALFAGIFGRSVDATASVRVGTYCEFSFNGNINYSDLTQAHTVVKKGYYRLGVITNGDLVLVPYSNAFGATSNWSDRCYKYNSSTRASGTVSSAVCPTGFESGAGVYYMNASGLVIGMCTTAGIVTFGEYVQSQTYFTSARNSGLGYGYFTYDPTSVCDERCSAYRLPNSTWANAVGSCGSSVLYTPDMISTKTAAVSGACCVETVMCSPMDANASLSGGGQPSLYYVSGSNTLIGGTLGEIVNALNSASYQVCFQCPSGYISLTTWDTAKFYSLGSGVNSCIGEVSGVNASGATYFGYCTYQ